MVRPMRALAGVVLIGIGVVIALGWWNKDTAEATGEVPERMRTVEINNESGDVTITAGDTDVTRVHQVFRYRWNEPDDAYRASGDELVLEGCGWGCEVDYEVVVPRGTSVTGELSSGTATLRGVGDVDLQASSGDVAVQQVDGRVNLEANSGEIRVADVAGPVTANANSGNIHGERLRGAIDLQASSANIQLSLDRAQNVTAQASSGNIELTVPDQPYRVNAETNGSQQIEVPTDPSAAHTLNLDASSGNVTVRPAR